MKIEVIVISCLVLLAGCSATWQGVKKDSSDAWENTKETSSEVYHSTKKAIHDATADEDEQPKQQKSSE
jgi:predicted small secreted protein